MNTYLCFDLGGTYTKYALITQAGELVLADKYRTGKIVDAKEVLEQFVVRYFELKGKMKDCNIVGAGFSCHGIVDPKKGCIAFGSPYVKALENYPLLEAFKQKTGLQLLVIENDVNAAAIAESSYCQAHSYKNYIFLTLGTSIGGAIVINGELYRGFNNAAGEFGYIITNDQDKNDQSMLAGAWEGYASAKALLQMYCTAVLDSNLSIEEFKQRLANGDQLADEVFKSYLARLIPGLVSLVHVLAPQAIVIGGAISEDPFFLEKVREKFYQKVLPFYQRTEVIAAHLGNYAGVYGVARLLIKKRKSKKC